MVAFFINLPAFFKKPLLFFLRGLEMGAKAVALEGRGVLKAALVLLFLPLLMAFFATIAVVAVGAKDAMVAFLMNLPAFFKKPLLFFFRGLAIDVAGALLTVGAVLALGVAFLDAMLADGTTGIA